MLGGTTAAIRIVAVLIIVVIGAAALWYVSSLKADLAVSTENTKKMVDAVEQQQAIISQIQQDQTQIRAINTELNNTIQLQNKDVADLKDRFTTNAAGQKRDFGAIAAARPEVLQRTINRASDRAIRCLELATGARHTAEELAATTPDAVNRECPALANPNYAQEIAQ